MAALTDNTKRATRERRLIKVPVAATSHIFSNSLVSFDADGYLIAAADTANTIFKGIATHEADNTNGADGAIECIVEFGILFKVCSTETETQDCVGLLRYVVTDQEVAAIGTTTNDVVVGQVVEFVDASTVWIDPEVRA